MGDGGVDLHGLQGLLTLLLLRLVLEGAHVVQAVAQLDENHPHVLGHGHEHLAQVLHLLLFLGGVLHPGQLGDPFHQVRHRGAKEFGDVVVGGVGVLNAVVEQGGDDGVQIQVQLVDNLRHRQGVGDVGLSALAQLGAVVGVGVVKGSAQPLHIGVGVALKHLLLQSLVACFDGFHGHTSSGVRATDTGVGRAHTQNSLSIVWTNLVHGHTITWGIYREWGWIYPKSWRSWRIMPACSKSTFSRGRHSRTVACWFCTATWMSPRSSITCRHTRALP